LYPVLRGSGRTVESPHNYMDNEKALQNLSSNLTVIIDYEDSVRSIDL